MSEAPNVTYPDAPTETVVPCALCDGTMANLSELDRWRVWTLSEDVSQRPRGHDRVPPVMEPAGTFYIMCGPCSDQFASGEFRCLARSFTDRQLHGREVSQSERDLLAKEFTLWIMKVQRHACDEPLGTFLQRRLNIGGNA